MTVPPPPPPTTATRPVIPPPPPPDGRRPPTVPAPPPPPRPQHDGGPPDHIKRILAARGDHDPDTGAWRTVRFERCPKCNAWTALGLDDVGLTRRVDPSPLTEHGELQAVIEQRHTYTLTAKAGEPTKLQLSFPRYRIAITSKPAPTHVANADTFDDGRDYDVVADHTCGLDRDHHQRTASVHDRRTHQPDNDRPPF